MQSSSVVGSMSEVFPYFVGMVALSILPMAILCVSSFVKIQVVLSILRNALGAGQLPSVAITTVLAIVLTAGVMAPVVEESVRSVLAFNQEQTVGSSLGSRGAPQFQKPGTIQNLVKVLGVGIEPFRKFILGQTAERERKYFAHVLRSPEFQVSDRPAVSAAESRGESGNSAAPEEGQSIFTLIPAFLVSQLREAFEIGFVLFLPFLIVDLVVSNILVGLGMNMVSPVSVALPFKLLLFVVCDGWFLLSKGLLETYGMGGA